MRRLGAFSVSLAVASAMTITSCDGDDDKSTTPTYRQPSPPVTTLPHLPTPSAPTSPTTPAPAPNPSSDSRYTLNQQQAYQSALAGRAVGGKTPSGEVQVAKTTITVNERRPTRKCGNEYDSYTGDYEY